jgi:hypothetical protein
MAADFVFGRVAFGRVDCVREADVVGREEVLSSALPKASCR